MSPSFWGRRVWFKIQGLGPRFRVEGSRFRASGLQLDFVAACVDEGFPFCSGSMQLQCASPGAMSRLSGSLNPNRSSKCCISCSRFKGFGLKDFRASGFGG